MRRIAEHRVGLENEVELRNELDHVLLRAPVEVVLAVDVDLLRAIPLDAVRNAPRALPAQQSGELDAQPRVYDARFGEAVVVVRFGEVDEGAVFLAALDRRRQIPLERAAVVGLEYLRIRPIEVGLRKQAIRRLQPPAKALKHEDGEWILVADARDDVLPRLGRNHVSRVAAEPVHALATPEKEHVRHVGAKLRIGIVEFDEVGPFHAPCAGADEASVALAMEPVWVVGLERRRPAGVIGGKVDEEEPATRMDCVDEFAELVERRRVFIELRHCRIDRKKIERGERAAVFAHHGVRRGHRERRQGLDYPEAHLVHHHGEPPHYLAERTELAREYRVDGAVLADIRRLYLDMRVAAVRPFRHLRTVWEETRLA